MFLAIDTSAGSSVALVHETDRVLAEASEVSTMRHAEVIGSLIAEVLGRATVDPSQIDGVAVGMGPGPFTGLRVGIAAARAFALGLGVPVLPVVSHDAVARNWYQGGGVGPVVVVTDARRRERYWSAYDGVDSAGCPRRSDGPGLASPDAVPFPLVPRLDADRVSAGHIGLLAAAFRDRGAIVDIAEPLYLRSPDVTLSSGPKRVTS